MAQEYLPAPSNIRLADLMKEHNISQPELAKEIGCSKSTISRFISGAKGTLTHEQVLKIARLFNVSTDFLLGETNIPDRKNYDIAELGLSVEAAKNLYTGRVNTEVVNLLLENTRFAELTYRIAQYFDDTFASGIAAQNAMLTTLSTLLRTKVIRAGQQLLFAAAEPDHEAFDHVARNPFRQVIQQRQQGFADFLKLFRGDHSVSGNRPGFAVLASV